MSSGFCAPSCGGTFRVVSLGGANSTCSSWLPPFPPARKSAPALDVTLFAAERIGGLQEGKVNLLF